MYGYATYLLIKISKIIFGIFMISNNFNIELRC